MNTSDLNFWDSRDPTTPNDDILGAAIQVQIVMRETAEGVYDIITVNEAAIVFNVTPRRAARAILNSSWMFLIAREPGCGHIDNENDLKRYDDKFISELVIDHEDN